MDKMSTPKQREERAKGLKKYGDPKYKSDFDEFCEDMNELVESTPSEGQRTLYDILEPLVFGKVFVGEIIEQIEELIATAKQEAWAEGVQEGNYSTMQVYEEKIKEAKHQERQEIAKWAEKMYPLCKNKESFYESLLKELGNE